MMNSYPELQLEKWRSQAVQVVQGVKKEKRKKKKKDIYVKLIYALNTFFLMILLL